MLICLSGEEKKQKKNKLLFVTPLHHCCTFCFGLLTFDKRTTCNLSYWSFCRGLDSSNSFTFLQ